MMSGGIGFRAAGIFIAFFYSGLGLALALAGVIFTKNYMFYNQLIEKETGFIMKENSYKPQDEM